MGFAAFGNFGVVACAERILQGMVLLIKILWDENVDGARGLAEGAQGKWNRGGGVW